MTSWKKCFLTLPRKVSSIHTFGKKLRQKVSQSVQTFPLRFDASNPFYVRSKQPDVHELQRALALSQEQNILLKQVAAKYEKLKVSITNANYVSEVFTLKKVLSFWLIFKLPWCRHSLPPPRTPSYMLEKSATPIWRYDIFSKKANAPQYRHYSSSRPYRAKNFLYRGFRVTQANMFIEVDFS